MWLTQNQDVRIWVIEKNFPAKLVLELRRHLQREAEVVSQLRVGRIDLERDHVGLHGAKQIADLLESDRQIANGLQVRGGERRRLPQRLHGVISEKKRGFWSDVGVLTGDLDGAERVERVGAPSGGA